MKYQCYKCDYETDSLANWLQHKAWCWLSKAVGLFNEVK